MTETKTSRAPRCSQRHRIFSRRVDVLRCLDDGMSIKAMAVELDLTDIPMPSIYRNVAGLRDKYRPQNGIGESISNTLTIPASEPGTDHTGSDAATDSVKVGAKSAPPQGKFVHPAADGASLEPTEKPRRKKRQFVAATIGGNADDDLNPRKWREERRARKNEKDA